MTAAARRGASLVELLAVMAATSVVMTVGVGLVHRTLRLQSHTRHDLEHDHTALALGRQLRADMREATAAVTDDPAALLVLRSTAGTQITYRRTPRGLERIATTAAGGTRREDYEFPRLLWRATCAGRLVTLAGTGPEPPQRPLRVEVCGALLPAGPRPNPGAAEATRGAAP